jgi:GWxTD domain-containing protein
MTALRIVYAIFFAITAAVLPAASLPGQEQKPAREELSEWSKQWLDEVVPYIITKAERQVFLSFPTEVDRGRFIESFWKRRDPDPATPVNEYKEQYYKRIGAANKLFGTSGLAGWRTERGRFFILLGPPHEIQRDFNVTDERGFNSMNKETWQYWGLPNPKLPYNLELVFVDRNGNGNFVLDWNVMSAKGTQSGNLNDVTYQFDTMEILAEAQKNPFENLDRIKTVVTTQVTYDLVPFEFKTYAFKGEGGLSRVRIVIDIPYVSLPSKAIAGKDRYSLNVLAQVSDSLGRVVAQKSRDVSFDIEPGEKASVKDGQIKVQTSLSLEPGTYGIHFVVWDNFSGKAGTRHAALAVPGFGTGEPSMSDIVLSASGKSDPVVAASALLSTARRDFRNGDEMEVSLEVYGLTLDQASGTNSLRADFEFLKDSRTVLKAPTLDPEPSARKEVRIRNAFRLKNFLPGEYTLRITIVDRCANRTLSRDAAFVIAE